MANKNNSKKFHFIYKTTNLLNNKFYIGMHSTANLADGYLGSGTRLRRSIRRHGKENFKFEILEFLSTRKELVAREKELVTKEQIEHPSCMNLKPGGEGGFNNEEHQYKCQAAGGRAVRRLLGKKHHERMKSDKKYRDKWFDSVCKASAKRIGKPGHAQSEESKKKIGFANSLTQKGTRNSQYGTCWITKDSIDKKIKKELLDTFMSQGWDKGRK